MGSFDITSATNPRIKRLVRLREDRRFRHTEGVFVVEGGRTLARALESGHLPSEVYWDGTTPIPREGKSVTVDPAVLDRASYRQRSEGVIAVFPLLATGLETLPEAPTLVLGAENLEKPGNLGAMLRTADAVGADGFVALGTGVDPFNPNVVRASTGALFTVPIATCTLEELLPWLEHKGIGLVATTPGTTSTIWGADLVRPCLLLVGAEDEGLSQEARDAAHTVVSLPMAGTVDSLNVSVALAVVAYEAVRQRFSEGR
jgi:TrmH family RNA methyltransferase